MEKNSLPLRLSKRKRLLIGALLMAVLSVWYYFSLPQKLFEVPYATVIEDSKGNAIHFMIAADGQWRLPPSSPPPAKFVTCLRLFEDEHFFHHPGFNPFSLFRAFWQNLRAGKVVSGGSTLTMQTVRLSRMGQPRTVWEKLVELLLATRLELRHSKQEILKLYAAHAPFGGNIVGLEAAAMRYYGRPAQGLSWGEAATLAVLPNQPALVFPGNNQRKLFQKRNRLLDKMLRKGILDSLTVSLAKEEPMPERLLPIPTMSPHLLNRCLENGQRGQKVQTTLSQGLQKVVTDVVERFQHRYKGNRVFNAAAMVLDTRTGAVRAYVGNVGHDPAHGFQVDVISSPRSTGSILKPFLYAAMLEEGMLLPNMLVPDIPTFMGGFAPQNFDGTYAGAVPADLALARSLNVPAVRLLMRYKPEKFHAKLRQLGIGSLIHPADHYGLSLILGGAEATLWDLCGMYASMGRTLLNFHEHAPHPYFHGDWRPPHYTFDPHHRPAEHSATDKFGKLNAGAIWFTFQALLQVERPGQEAFWEMFADVPPVAWKTGTSYGHRDAWAIGVTPGHVVGVWVGNADGEGRPGLTGYGMAAPILFEIFRKLPASGWFTPPYDEMVEASVCAQSGHLPGPYCDQLYTASLPVASERSEVCPYHKLVHTDATGRRVHGRCEDPQFMEQHYFFVLPPGQEWFYKQRDPSYQTLPPWREDCLQTRAVQIPNMQVLYPPKNTTVTIPTELDGTKGKVVVEVAHRNPSALVYWHLDEKFLGTTQHFHQMALNPTQGSHRLTLTDAEGEVLRHHFFVK